MILYAVWARESYGKPEIVRMFPEKEQAVAFVEARTGLLYDEQAPAKDSYNHQFLTHYAIRAIETDLTDLLGQLAPQLAGSDTRDVTEM